MQSNGWRDSKPSNSTPPRAPLKLRRDAASAQQVTELKVELSRREALAASLEARAVAAEARSLDAQQRLDHLQQQLANDTGSDVARLEAQLRERGERLRELEAQLKSVEMVGHQLLRDLEAARTRPSPALRH